MPSLGRDGAAALWLEKGVEQHGGATVRAAAGRAQPSSLHPLASPRRGLG